MTLRYWIFVILTLLLTTGVSLATYRSAKLLQRWQPEQNLLFLMSENIIRLLLVALCLGLGWLSGLPPQQFGWTAIAWQQALVQGLLLGVLMAASFYLGTRWIVARSGEKFYSRTIVESMLPRTGPELVLTAIVMVGVVAAEEMLFRSLLLGGLQPIAPAALLLVLSSVLFGVLHLPQGAWGIAGAALAGALLGALFLVSGSILAPAAAHYVTNMAQIVQAKRDREREGESQEPALDG